MITIDEQIFYSIDTGNEIGEEVTVTQTWTLILLWLFYFPYVLTLLLSNDTIRVVTSDNGCNVLYWKTKNKVKKLRDEWFYYLHVCVGRQETETETV